jgi:hypothetical protein
VLARGRQLFQPPHSAESRCPGCFYRRACEAEHIGAVFMALSAALADAMLAAQRFQRPTEPCQLVHRLLVVDTHHFQVIGRKPSLRSLSGCAWLKKNRSSYLGACGMSSLWRGGKTKPAWKGGKAQLYEAGNPARESWNPITAR